MSDCNWCNSSDHIWRPNRREFLYVGVIGSFGLTLGNYFKLHAESAAGKVAASDAKTKAVINIYLPGGMAAQENASIGPDHPVPWHAICA